MIDSSTYLHSMGNAHVALILYKSIFDGEFKNTPHDKSGNSGKKLSTQDQR